MHRACGPVLAIPLRSTWFPRLPSVGSNVEDHDVGDESGRPDFLLGKPMIRRRPSEIASAVRMEGNSQEAAILLGASDAHVSVIGSHRAPAAHQSWHELMVERLVDDFGDDDYRRLHALGAGLPFKEAVERALAEAGDSGPAS